MPRRFGWVFVAFAVALAGYVLLLAFGPPLSTPEGRSIQAIGQKLIVYTAIVCILAQALMAYRLSVTR